MKIPSDTCSRRRAGLALIILATIAANALPDSADAAVLASYNAREQTLSVLGDTLPNTITVSRNAGGQILVGGGAVAILGGTATVANTRLILVYGQGGNDTIALKEAGQPLPRGVLSGGAGDDALIGSSGVDSIFGDTGRDTADARGGDDLVLLGAGDDTAAWAPGAGNDTIGGGADRDRVKLVGSAADDKLSVGANGTSVTVAHGASGAKLNVFGVEDASLSAVGGADTIGIGALDATELRTVALDLAATAGGSAGDGARDRVAIQGADGPADRVTVTGRGAPPAVAGHTFSVAGGEASLDTLSVTTRGGADVIDAAALPAGLVGLTAEGGPGDDTVTGSAGDDLFRWRAGDGRDRLEGGAGRDALRAAGNGAPESFALVPDGPRARLSRDGAVATDLGALEDVRVSPAGGDDVAIVDNLTGTPVVSATVELAATPETIAPDARPDRVHVYGTQAADAVAVRSVSKDTSLSGLRAFVQVTGIDSTDGLAVHALGGNDRVDATGTTMPLRVEGSAGLDTLIGGVSNDHLLGGADNDTLDGGPGKDVLDGGVGTDTASNGETLIGVP